MDGRPRYITTSTLRISTFDPSSAEVANNTGRSLFRPQFPSSYCHPSVPHGIVSIDSSKEGNMINDRIEVRWKWTNPRAYNLLIILFILSLLKSEFILFFGKVTVRNELESEHMHQATETNRGGGRRGVKHGFSEDCSRILGFSEIFFTIHGFSDNFRFTILGFLLDA